MARGTAFRRFGLAALGLLFATPAARAHVDIVSAEDGPDNQVVGPLVEFLARNAQWNPCPCPCPCPVQ